MFDTPNRRDVLKGAAAGAALFAGRTATAKAPPAGVDAAAANRKLADHRIAKITARRMQDRYPRQVGANTRKGPQGHGGSFQVRTITTDQGAVGWGMCHANDERVRTYVGTRLGDLFDVATGLTVDDAPFFNIVLHDLAGQILGLPVWKYLGAAGPEKVLLYSGAIYFDDLLPTGKPRGVAGVLASCKQDYDAGYRAFKLKIGRGAKWMKRPEGLRRDIEVTRAVKRTFADCRVLVDANDGYTVDEMCDYVKAVADCDLYWIEEPFEENRDGLKKLKDAMAAAGCRARIADGERRENQARPPTAYGGYTKEFTDRLYALASEKLVDVFLLDLGILGFSRWRRVMGEMAKAGVKASPHTWAWTPRPYYAAQLAAGVGNVDIVEGIPGRAKGIDYSAYRMEKGKLVMPDTPGFGLKLT